MKVSGNITAESAFVDDVPDAEILRAAKIALALELHLLAEVDPVRDSRLWDEHDTRIQRLEQVISKLEP